MNREIITNNDPKSPISEIFRTLRTNIQYMKRSDKAQSILITSTVQGEGKSFIASNIAVTFAQAGKNTIIVDADMRRPKQHKKFETQMYPGLSNYLSGVDLDRLKRELKFDDCIYQTQVENLWIMPSGNIPPNPSELLQSLKFDELMSELEKQFEVIVIDGTPCLAVTDSIIISRLATHTVLVCSQNVTKVDELKEVKRLIEQVGGNIAGVVINKVSFSKKRLEYSNYASNNSLTKSNRSRHEKSMFEKSSKSATIKYNSVWTNEKTNSSIKKDNEKDEIFNAKDTDIKETNEKSADKTSGDSSKSKKNHTNSSRSKSTRSENNSNADEPDKLNEILKQINELRENNKI